jgi:hypothetical protein
MDVISRILKHGSRSVGEVVVQVLGGIADEGQRLREATMCVHNAMDLEERAGEIVGEVRLYIENYRLWAKGGYRSLDAFKRSIDFTNYMAMAVERSLVVGRRKGIEHSGILRNWRRPLHEVIPDDIKPEYYSENLLKALNRMSKVCDHGEVAELLREAIARRLEEREERVKLTPTPTLIARDVSQAIEMLEEARRAQETTAKKDNQPVSGQKRKRDAPAKKATSSKDTGITIRRPAKPTQRTGSATGRVVPQPNPEHTVPEARVMTTTIVTVAGMTAEAEQIANIAGLTTAVTTSEQAYGEEEATDEGEREEAGKDHAGESENVTGKRGCTLPRWSCRYCHKLRSTWRSSRAGGVA